MRLSVWHIGRLTMWLTALLLVAASPVAAETPDPAALAAYEAQLPALRQAAPDVVLGRLRQRATALMSPLPGFDPGSRMVDVMVEQPWPALRRRCDSRATPAAAPLGAPAALTLVDDMLRESRVTTARPADRGALAAMLAALDGRVCRCADRPSLALAADCAS